MTAPVETPAAETKPLVPTPQGIPTPPSLSDIMDAARGKIQPILDQAASQDGEPHHATTQPRDDAGKFAKPAEPEVVDPNAPAVDAAPVDGEPAEPVVDPELVVSVPGDPEGPDFEYVAETKEAADRLRALKNGYMRGEEARKQLDQVDDQRADLADEQARILADPVGWLMQGLRQGSQEDVQTVALRVITEPAVWSIVQAMADELNDDKSREAIKAKLDLALRDRRDAVLEQQRGTKFLRTVIRKTTDVIRGLAPKHLSQDQQDGFIRDAKMDLAAESRARAARGQSDVIHPNDVPQLLSSRLALYQALGGVPPIPQAPVVPTGTTGKPVVRSAVKPTGAQFVRGKAERDAVATLPTAGHGSPSVGSLRPPPGMDIQQAVAWARTQRLQRSA